MSAFTPFSSPFKIGASLQQHKHKQLQKSYLQKNRSNGKSHGGGDNDENDFGYDISDRSSPLLSEEDDDNDSVMNPNTSSNTGGSSSSSSVSRNIDSNPFQTTTTTSNSSSLAGNFRTPILPPTFTTTSSTNANTSADAANVNASSNSNSNSNSNTNTTKKAKKTKKSKANSLDSQFDYAVKYLKKQAHLTVSNEVKLTLYGLYKQVTEGNCDKPSPSIFDFVEKSKWKAWKANENLSKEEAINQYIKVVKDLDPSFEIGKKIVVDPADKKKKNNEEGKAGFVVVSSFAKETEIEILDSNKSAFDWCKEGKESEMVSVLKLSESIDIKDEQGMALLHWASDRGFDHIVTSLVSLKADVNICDETLQTPLHYAVACEHEEVVRILLISGANPLLKDEDDETPVSLATNLAIKEMLNKAVNGQLPDNVSRKKSVTFDVSVKKDDDDDDNDDGIGEEDSDSDSNLETDEEEEDGDGENDNGRGVEKSSQQSTFSTLLSPSSSSSSSNLNTTNHPSYAETFVYSRHSGEDSINRHEPNYSDDIDKTFSWFNPSSWPGSTTAKVISVGAVAVIGALALRAVLGKRRRARK